MNRWQRAFQIFGENGLGDYDVYAEHDILYVMCRAIGADSALGLELQALGWQCDEDSWYHYV